MAKTGKFYHLVNSEADASVTNAFGGASKTDIELLNCIPSVPGAVADTPFNGKLEGLVVRVKTVAGGATKLTIKITVNSVGASVLIPDTEATIGFEVGSTTVGAVAFFVGFPYVAQADDLSIFYKTDAGTCTVDGLDLYWSE